MKVVAQRLPDRPFITRLPLKNGPQMPRLVGPHRLTNEFAFVPWLLILQRPAAKLQYFQSVHTSGIISRMLFPIPRAIPIQQPGSNRFVATAPDRPPPSVVQIHGRSRHTWAFIHAQEDRIQISLSPALSPAPNKNEDVQFEFGRFSALAKQPWKHWLRMSRGPLTPKRLRSTASSHIPINTILPAAGIIT